MTSFISENNYFKSADLPLIACLACYGQVVESIDRSSPRRAIFYVKRNEQTDELVARFYSRNLTVCPSSFFHALKDLKGRLYTPID